jgi:hypothetical protein
MATTLPDTLSLAAGQTVKSGKGEFYGFNVTTVTATGAINFYDNTAASGKVLASIPASTAVGTSFFPPNGIPFKTGLHVEFNGGATGTVLVHYK